jgi:hypothetical protein
MQFIVNTVDDLNTGFVCVDSTDIAFQKKESMLSESIYLILTECDGRQNIFLLIYSISNLSRILSP